MKMLKAAGIFWVFLALTSVPLWAANSKKAKTAQEIYPAFEPGTEGAPASVATPAPAPIRKKAKVNANSSKGGYELVPSTQAEPIILRLKIVEELIRKYGRAYDYRVHTLKELQSILSDLDASRGAQSSAPSAPLTSDESSLPPPPPAANSSSDESKESTEPAQFDAPKDASPAFSPNIHVDSLGM